MIRRKPIYAGENLTKGDLVFVTNGKAYKSNYVLPSHYMVMLPAAKDYEVELRPIVEAK